MTEIGILKQLFKAFAGHEHIVITRRDGSKLSGTIQQFDGEIITIRGDQLFLSDIISVDTCDEKKDSIASSFSASKYQEYKNTIAEIVFYQDGDQIELSGYIFDIRDGLLALVTDFEKKLIDCASIKYILSTDHHYIESREKISKNGEKTALEVALLAADKDAVDRYVRTRELLCEQGYNDAEIRFIQKPKVTVPWHDDENSRLYHQARRIYEYEGNRYQIVSNLIKAYLSECTSVNKTRIKALALLADIYAQEHSKEIVPFFAQNEQLIRSNKLLLYKVASAFIQMGEFSKARMLIDETRFDIDFSDLLFSLSFYEKHPDLSCLPGVDAFDNSTSYKELSNLIKLPDKVAFSQLLSYYSAKGKASTFFSLLDLFLPYAKNDAKIVSLVGDFLRKEMSGSFLKHYLPMFPTLWLNKSIAKKYLEIVGNDNPVTETDIHLLNQCRRASLYSLPNELEEAVIKGNNELFEVLRGNTSILISLGYSSEEIGQIRGIDSDLIRYGNKPIIEKLFGFEGNRNHVAESTAGQDFLSSPKEVGRVLFPILINDGAGDLVFELFHYSKYIRYQLSSMESYYLKALLLLEKYDEFWEQIRTDWLNKQLESKELLIAQKIAQEKNCHELAKAIGLYAIKPAINELENAIIDGNIPKMRSLIFDAEYLTATGYTLEEIRLLQESMRRSVDISSDDHYSIANRIYTFQRNKNRTAELYYMLALAENNSLAAVGLFSIYANENRYNELCDVYETYLANDALGSIVQNKESYLCALFEIGRYEEFYSHWKSGHQDVSIDPVIVLNVFLHTSVQDSEIEQLLGGTIKATSTNKEIAKECLSLLFRKEASAKASAFITRLFNLFIIVCEKTDALMIESLVKDSTLRFEIPSGIGLTVLAHKEQKNNLQKWIQYLFELYPGSEEKLQILSHVIDVYDDGSLTFRNAIRDCIKDLISHGVDVPAEYKTLIKPVFSDDAEKASWLRERILHLSDIDEIDFEIIISLAEELHSVESLERVFITLSGQALNFDETYVSAALHLLHQASALNLPTDVVNVLLKCISSRLTRIRVSSESLAILSSTYCSVADFSNAFMARYSLTECGVNEPNVSDDNLPPLFEQNLSLFEVVKQSLRKSVLDIDYLASVYGKYIRTNESDAAGLETIRDYYNSPQKWDDRSLESLARYILAKPKTVLYWRLLAVYFADDSLERISVRYHIAKLDETSIGPIIADAAQHNYRESAVLMLQNYLNTSSSDVFERSISEVKNVACKHSEWLSDEITASELLVAIHGNSCLRESSHTWYDAVNFAMDIAFYGHSEGAFYALFHEDLKSDFAAVNERFLCRLLLSGLDHTELIQKVLASINDDAIDTPYGQVVRSVISEFKQKGLSPAQRGLLQIVVDNNGNSRDEDAVYKYYLRTIIEGDEDVAKQVIDQLETYYPNWAVINDIKKYVVLSHDVDDTALLELYKNECTSIQTEPVQERAYKSIVNTLPGELYLQSKGYDIASIYEYGLKTLPNRLANNLRIQTDLFMSLDNVFSEESFPCLSAIFMRCTFLRKWEEFLTYHLDDPSINRILRTDETIKKLLRTKTYEVLKSSILCILNFEKDNEKIVDRAFSLMAATEGLKQSKNYLRRIYALDQYDEDALRKIFRLRIESTSLRRNGLIGASILQIVGNEKVAYLIGLLDSKHLADLFNNNAVMDVLLKMPTDKAYAIAEIYSTFFFKGISNVFSKFLTDQTSTSDPAITISNGFENEVDNCKPFRDLFLKSKGIYDQVDSPSAAQRRKYAASKAEYLFKAVISNSSKDLAIIQPTCTDYLTVFIFLFNRHTTKEMKEYLWHLDYASLSPSLVVVLSLLEQYVSAYNVALQIEESLWRDAAYEILFKAMYATSIPVEKEIKQKIQSLIQVELAYSIGKSVPVKQDQIPPYLQKMEDLRTFLDEALSYLAYCGIDVSSITFDQERYEKALNRYTIDAKKEPENTIALKIAEEPLMTVSQYIDKDDILTLVERFKEVEVLSRSEKPTPTLRECIGEIKYFIAAKRNSQDTKDIFRIRDLLRWTYLRMIEEDGYSREFFNRTLELISKDDSISKAQWSTIVFHLIEYFDSVDSLQKLSRIVENDIACLRNIGNVSNANFRLLSNQDLESWELILVVLEDLARSNTETNERDRLDQLAAIRNRILAAQKKNKGTVFARVLSALVGMISNEITSLRHTPELSISVPEEQKDNTLSILWESENNKGTLFAVVSNIGGADCGNVTLVSRINMKSVRRFKINTIYAGERIPFKVDFYPDDIVGGKLTWDIEVSYYNAENRKPISLLHVTSVTVEKGGEPINIGVINTGNPAKGKDFVGRRRELSLLLNQYSDEQQIPSMLIRGLKRSGKSSLLFRLADDLKKRDRFIVAMIDGQSIGGSIRSAFVNKVLDSIRISYRSSKEYSDVMSEQFNSFQSHWQSRMDSSDWIGNLDLFYYELSQLFRRKLLIVVDEMESIFYNHRFDSAAQEESLYAALRSLIQNPDNYVSFIFCGSDALLTSCLDQKRESQMFQTLQFVEVGRMNSGDIREVFIKQSNKYDLKFTADAVDAIWQYTHGLIWYAKLIGYLVVNNIFAKDLAVRKEVNRSDVATAVQMLINGEIGTDKYDLVDASLNNVRSSLVHAMASIMPDYNKEVSIDEIITAMKMMKMEGYKNPRTAEPIPECDEKQIVSNLEFLEKMQFLDANASRTKFAFTADLYRLFFRTDKKLHLFEERGV